MQKILLNSSTTENSNPVDLGVAASGKLILDVVDAGAWSGTLKVAGRARGRGGATFSTYLPLVNLNTGAAIAAGTGITAAGLYSVDISGLEVRVEHTWTAGSVSVYGEPVSN